MVKYADLQRRGCHFDSSMCHIKNAIGEEGNGKHLINSTSLEKKIRALSLVSATLEIVYALQLNLRR